MAFDHGGVRPDAEVTIDVESTPTRLGTVTTTASGTFSVTYDIPCTIGNGLHTIVATVVPTGQVATAEITVSGCTAGGSTPKIEVVASATEGPGEVAGSATEGPNPNPVAAQPATTG